MDGLDLAWGRGIGLHVDMTARFSSSCSVHHGHDKKFCKCRGTARRPINMKYRTWKGLQ